MDVEAQTVAIAIAAASALAASVSARASRQAVTRANTPFVWPSISILPRSDSSGWSLKVRLYNDGPAVAFDVRFSVHDDTTEGPVGRVVRYVTPPVPAMRSGEAVPPRGAEPEILDDAAEAFVISGPREITEPWWVVVRYADALGREWEVRKSGNAEARTGPARQLRTTWWQRHRRPADW